MNQPKNIISDIISTLHSDPTSWLAVYSELQWAAKGQTFGRRLRQFRGLDIQDAPKLAREICGKTTLRGRSAGVIITDDYGT